MQAARLKMLTTMPKNILYWSKVTKKAQKKKKGFQSGSGDSVDAD
jgi:hypothetical protein